MNERSIQVMSGCNLDVPEGYIWRVEPDPNHLSVNRPYDSLYHMYLMKKWRYPEWLGGAGVYCDVFGVWFVSPKQPHLEHDAKVGYIWRIGRQSHHAFGQQLYEDVFPLWEPPHCTDWKESWHPNPNPRAK